MVNGGSIRARVCSLCGQPGSACDRFLVEEVVELVEPSYVLERSRVACAREGLDEGEHESVGLVAERQSRVLRNGQRSIRFEAVRAAPAAGRVGHLDLGRTTDRARDEVQLVGAAYRAESQGLADGELE